MKGIDIAKWNPVYDYAKVAPQIDFAIIKIINKSNTEDSRFSTHLNGCKANDIPIYGVYNYSYADSNHKAIIDAKAVIRTMQEHGLHTIVWLDVEEVAIAKRMGSALYDMILAYKQTIEDAGYTFGVYTGLYYYTRYIQPYERLDVAIPMWIARYPSSVPMKLSVNPSESKKPNVRNLAAWQYSSKGIVDGISGYVDLNIAYNNYETSSSNVATYPVLRYGSRNDYVKAWQTFLNLNGYSCGANDGIFGKRTLEAVKAWQKAHNLVVDGIIGAKTWASLPQMN